MNYTYLGIRYLLKMNNSQEIRINKDYVFNKCIENHIKMNVCSEETKIYSFLKNALISFGFSEFSHAKQL